MAELSRSEQQVLERAERRRGRRSPLLRWRLRSWRAADPLELAAVEAAIGAVLDDPAAWEIRSEAEILARYAKAGFAVGSLEEVRTTVPLAAADKLALIGARPVGPVKQLRNRATFRGRLPEECAQVVREALTPLVHNAAVYGYRAGEPDERAFALRALGDGEASVARVLVRAKSGARVFTGMRPGFADFNGWYLTRVAQESHWLYRERFVRARAEPPA